MFLGLYVTMVYALVLTVWLAKRVGQYDRLDVIGIVGMIFPVIILSMGVVLGVW